MNRLLSWFAKGLLATGIGLGQLSPRFFQFAARLEIAPPDVSVANIVPVSATLFEQRLRVVEGPKTHREAQRRIVWIVLEPLEGGPLARHDRRVIHRLELPVLRGTLLRHRSGVDEERLGGRGRRLGGGRATARCDPCSGKKEERESRHGGYLQNAC